MLHCISPKIPQFDSEMTVEKKGTVLTAEWHLTPNPEIEYKTSQSHFVAGAGMLHVMCFAVQVDLEASLIFGGIYSWINFLRIV